MQTETIETEIWNDRETVTDIQREKDRDRDKSSSLSKTAWHLIKVPLLWCAI